MYRITALSAFALLLVVSLSKNSFAQVDYASEIQSIFNDNCTGCHPSGGRSGVSLVSYEKVMNSVGNQYGKNIVQPEEPDNSPLVDKIEPDPDHGSRMPQGGQLSEDQIDLIRQWIAEGANETPTSLEEPVAQAFTFELHGNYPNPFNPSTTINFTVNRPVDLTLAIYSLSGNLVLEKQLRANPGKQRVQVRMDNAASGIYYYEIRGSFQNRPLSESGRMVLLK